MDTDAVGPGTDATTAARYFYHEAMLIWRQKGDREDVMALLTLARECAFVSIAESLQQMRNTSHSR